jgi:nicotinate phosphoribosyltransferase
MFFESESEAFQTYAEALPNNAVFLVDTYDSLSGVRRAIRTGKWLRAHGHEPIGVRLDSGDRIALSIEARRMLDAAGFPDAAIVCSGDLDEYAIADMKARGAKINVWGVGTKLATGCPDAALSGIYKLGAIRRPGEPWSYRIKLSDEPSKTSCPGRLQIRRFHQPDGKFIADAIYEIDHEVAEPCVIVDPATNARHEISAAAGFTDLLVPIFRKGELVSQIPDIRESRDRAGKQLGCLPLEIARRDHPQAYCVGLEGSLHELRSTLIVRARGQST